MANRAVLSHYRGASRSYLWQRSFGPLRWLAERDVRALLELLAPRRGERVLDAGSGPGLHARLLTDLGLRVCAVDVVPEMIDATRPFVDEACVADVETLQLGRTFDKVLCWGVLDFVEDPERCIERLADHLAPGGRLVVLAPAPTLLGRCYRLWHRVLHRIHVHLPSWRTLDEAAQRAGLTLLDRVQPFPHCEAIAWIRIV